MSDANTRFTKAQCDYLSKLPMSRATLKAKMTEQWNDGTTKNLPKSYDGTAEGTKSPEILRDRTMKRQEIT